MIKKNINSKKISQFFICFLFLSASASLLCKSALCLWLMLDKIWERARHLAIGLYLMTSIVCSFT